MGKLNIHINWIKLINLVVEGLLTGAASAIAGGVAAEVLKSQGISTADDLKKLMEPK